MEMLEHADAIERGWMDIGRAAKESGVSLRRLLRATAGGPLNGLGSASVPVLSPEWPTRFSASG
jgi:hypothetical protein